MMKVQPPWIYVENERMLLNLNDLMCVSVTELQEDERERWEAFTSGQLADTNKKNTVDLVSAVCLLILP